MSKSNSGVSAHTNSGFPSDLLLELRGGPGRPKALALAQDLRAAILGGRLAAGTRLPPSRVLAAELGLSRSVVVQAFTDLIVDGYLEARQGAGTRVRGEPARAAAPPREAAPPPTGLEDALLRVPARVRLLAGLPDPQLFPRAVWARHYRAALAALPDPELGYPDSRGAEVLRRALAAYLGRVRAVLVAPEHVLVCGGVTQGLNLVCRALRRAGAKRIAVEDPCFGLHREAIALAGLEPVPVPVDEGGLDVAQLPAGVGAALVAPAHSFPTGGTLGGDRRRALVEWAARNDAMLLEDDYDAELRYDRTPVAALQGLAPDRVVYLGSASKTFTPALRLGWIAAPPQLAAALDDEKTYDDMGSSVLEQHAFARVLDKGELARHLRRIRPVYRRRRDATIAALAELFPDARRQGAAAGLHLYVTLAGDVDVRALRRAAYERGVLVEDAARHWADPADGASAIVVGYGSLPETSIRAALMTLREALVSYAHQ